MEHSETKFRRYNLSRISANVPITPRNKLKHNCELRQSGFSYHGIWGWLKDSLRKWTTVSTIHPLTVFYFPSMQSRAEECKRHNNSKYWFIIHPLSGFWFVWSIIMTVVFLVVIPLDFYDNIYGAHQVMVPHIWYKITFCLNLMNNIHIVVTFLTGYVNENVMTNVFSSFGMVHFKYTGIILSPWQIARRYVLTYYLIDMISFLVTVKLALSYFFPSTFILSKCDPDCILLRYNSAGVVFLEMLRIIRLKTVLSNVDLILTKFRKSTAHNDYRIFRCVFWYIFGIYYGAVLYIMLPSTIEYYKEREKWSFHRQMISRYRESNRNYTSNTIFVGFFMESLNTMTKGIHHFSFRIYEDYVSFIILLFFGLAIKILVFLTAFSMQEYLFKPYLDYDKLIKNLDQLIIMYDIQNPHKNYIKKYLRSTLHCAHTHEKEILKNFSENIKYEIFEDVSANLPRQSSILNGLDSTFIRNLMLKLKEEFHLPGDLILRQGDLASCMFFIASGTVAIYKNNEEVCHLNEGQHFGEYGLLVGYPNGRRKGTAISIDYCMVYRLEAPDFLEAIKQNIEFYRRISYKISERKWMKESMIHLKN